MALRDEEIAERRYRRLQRWFNKLPLDRRVLSAEDKQRLIDQGWADENGLTEAGELKLHQLETLEWMKNHPRKSKSDAP